MLLKKLFTEFCRMSLHESFLLLGSNMGDRNLFLQEARMLIEKKAGAIRQTSGIYETAPWGIETQASFLNQVLVIETSLHPELLMQTLLSIENEMGRVREEKMGPRTIDIDILFYDDLIHNSNDLIIPHPLLHLRRFVLQPLSEINPSKKHPLLQQSIAQLLADCKDPLKAEKTKSFIHNH
jgi:2-amino-4-hydroxy-6-hydroxymethyldihydropteridine diphosphokinase